MAIPDPDDDLYRFVGERIATTRGHLKLSQQKLALAVNLSRVSIVNIESGKQRAPIHVLWRIAAQLKVELTDLIPRQDDLRDSGARPNLSKAIMAQIERAAQKDPATLRYLTDFVQRESKPAPSTDGTP